MSIAIVCEGKNDKDFLYEFIAYLGFETQNIDPYILSGKSNVLKPVHKKYSDELLSELAQIEKILFIVDADDENNDSIYNGIEKTQTALNNLINSLDVSEISQTYIMCDPETKKGYLESLILSTIPDDQKKCIECFIDCTQLKPEKGHKTIYHKLYKTGYPDPKHNFEHENYEPLKTVLTNLFKSE